MSTTALEAAKYIRDNLLRLIELNVSGHVQMSITYTGNPCSNSVDGFEIKFSVYDGKTSENIQADSLENCVTELVRRRSVHAQYNTIRLPAFEPQVRLSTPAPVHTEETDDASSETPF